MVGSAESGTRCGPVAHTRTEGPKQRPVLLPSLGRTVASGDDEAEDTADTGSNADREAGTGAHTSTPLWRTFDVIGAACPTRVPVMELRAVVRGVEASAKGDAGLTGLEVGADAFAGARADASATGSVIWEQGNTPDMIKDFADNLPGNWDDALLDRIPDKVYERVAETLLGDGTVRLLAAEAGAGGRAGAGAGASASLKAADDGLLSVGANAGESVGLGAAVQARVSVNPLELLRLAVVRRIRTVNSVVGTLESVWKRFRGK